MILLYVFTQNVNEITWGYNNFFPFQNIWVLLDICIENFEK